MRCINLEKVLVIFANGSCKLLKFTELRLELMFVTASTESCLLSWTSQNQIVKTSAVESKYYRSLQLLKTGLVWLHADVYGELQVVAGLVEDNARMFGVQGAEAVISKKQKWLTEALNYNVDAIHEVDMENLTLVVGFDCLIPDKEGRGTDVVQFDAGMKVVAVGAIRHVACDM
jgi:hypothetical protein